MARPSRIGTPEVISAAEGTREAGNSGSAKQNALAGNFHSAHRSSRGPRGSSHLLLPNRKRPSVPGDEEPPEVADKVVSPMTIRVGMAKPAQSNEQGGENRNDPFSRAPR